MYSEKITIVNSAGLHARPASDFIREASKFKSKITIVLNEKSANAKSIVHVLRMGLAHGVTFTLIAEGSDEENAVKHLATFVASLK